MYDSSTADAAEVTLKLFLVTHQWFVPHATINNAVLPVPGLRDLWDIGRFHSPCKILERAPGVPLNVTLGPGCCTCGFADQGPLCRRGIRARTQAFGTETS